MKIYTSEQMRHHEQLAVASGSSFAQLMENAGQSASEDLLSRCPYAGRVLIVCGKGNNGGDGLVMARWLHCHGWQVDIWLVAGHTLSELAENNRVQLIDLPNLHFIQSLPATAHECYDVVIDAIFGTGFTGELPDAIAECCQQLNQINSSLKIALDMPTGINSDTATLSLHTFRADITYAFGAFKPAHIHPIARQFCGEIMCLDIGIP